MTQYAYTLSSVGTMPDYLALSLRSLLQFVDPSSVTVFFTPPRDSNDISQIEKFGVEIEEVDHRTKPFSAHGREQHYGAKTYLCTLEDSSVVFLDCDTIILDNPDQLTVGDFEIAARPDTSQVHQPGWRNLFERFDRSEAYIPWMPNAGVLVFKNQAHNEIEEKWIQYINTDLGYQHEYTDHHEQYAFALAAGDRKIRELTPREHVMSWANERPANGIVYHLGQTFVPHVDEAPKNLQEAIRFTTHYMKEQILTTSSKLLR